MSFQDASQNYKNMAQGQAALMNAETNKEKLKLAQLAAADKHELNKVKFARESFKLEQEATDYWNSLSEKDRQRIAGQFYIENQAQLAAYALQTENQDAKEKLKQRWDIFRVSAAEFKHKLWRVVAIILVASLVIPIAATIIIGFIQSLIHMQW